MFENISKSFLDLFKTIRDRGIFKKKFLKHHLDKIKTLLIDSDVSVMVVKKILQKIEKEILKSKIEESFDPSGDFIEIVRKTLLQIIGEKEFNLFDFSKRNHLIILLVGSKGSGKTTTASKIGRVLRKKYNKKVLLASTDTGRPAAFDQLKQLSEYSKVDFFEVNSKKSRSSFDLAKFSIARFKSERYDTLIVDTEGCMHTDLEKLDEIQKIHKIVNPSDTFFVIDSMVGQDAIHSSRTFNKKFPLDGIILTKMDGDSRGGCALSVKEVTGKPIAFLGTGEHISLIEPFHPKKIISKILGTEHTFHIMKDMKKNFSINIKKKLFQKKSDFYKFDLEDFLEQLNYMKNIDNLKKIVRKIPYLRQSVDNLIRSDIDESLLSKMKAIIQSMTHEERKNPEIIKSSRKRRISLGSGTKVQEINFLLKRFQEVKKMMNNFKKNKKFFNFF
ncbi:signal recognition particle protein [Candidatus Riesia pediculicola]|uniref:signal-recognition-particle GTPase n=1 Tax=Riesia pediculicola (strain USDA) TaxID=515618 RepID=D4G7M0_RIEPU|nr:signal recognition particle receptor subunit alpha [Candidatus Riesia pediculicola]ADD79533.1 Ffh protein [Candidatus Riesia pediculicola USDA]ARC53596.1 hypothetical protein AOE55_00280 [Candidatus Riesia pediculicola]QOJ86249.1 signal recognition particle protein [Candidatus Riesia pediculicola]